MGSKHVARVFFNTNIAKEKKVGQRQGTGGGVKYGPHGKSSMESNGGN